MVLHVCVCQINGKIGDINYNINLLENTIKEYKNNNNNHFDLFCFPELYLSGYLANKEQVYSIAQTKISLRNKIKYITKQYNIYLVVGYAEKQIINNNIHIFNSAILLSPNGDILSNYQKTHLYDPNEIHEKLIYSIGNTLPDIISINGIKCCLLICFDIEIPEVSRSLALNGVQCIIVPTANQSIITPDIIVRSRAIENSIFIIYCNRVGKDLNIIFCGQSVIYAPNGDLLKQASNTKEEILLTTIDPNNKQYKEFIHNNPILITRNPSLYSSLVE